MIILYNKKTGKKLNILELEFNLINSQRGSFSCGISSFTVDAFPAVLIMLLITLYFIHSYIYSMVQMDNASCGANEPKICYIKGMDYNFPNPPKNMLKRYSQITKKTKKSFIIQIRKLAKCKFSVC